LAPLPAVNLDEEKVKILTALRASAERQLSFDHFLPPPPADRRAAAVAFSVLLALEAEGKLVTEQAGFWQPLTVTKMF
jgi:chromatin segregation and condensation protein Rec8/ScpA/Scc1 (kleisin family)